MGKKEFGFLALTEKKGRYSIIPIDTIGGAARESAYALSALIDSIPKKNAALRKKAMGILQRITIALDMED